jgi:hypothetical protein
MYTYVYIERERDTYNCYGLNMKGLPKKAHVLKTWSPAVLIYFRQKYLHFSAWVYSLPRNFDTDFFLSL